MQRVRSMTFAHYNASQRTRKSASTDVSIITRLGSVASETVPILGGVYGTHSCTVPVAGAELPHSVLMAITGNGATGQPQVLHAMGTVVKQITDLWATLAKKHECLGVLQALSAALGTSAEGAFARSASPGLSGRRFGSLCGAARHGTLFAWSHRLPSPRLRARHAPEGPALCPLPRPPPQREGRTRRRRSGSRPPFRGRTSSPLSERRPPARPRRAASSWTTSRAPRGLRGARRCSSTASRTLPFLPSNGEGT